MRKISFFYSFAALLLVSVSMAVVPAHAQNTKYCIDKKDVSKVNPQGVSQGVLKLFQADSPANSSVECNSNWKNISTKIQGIINDWTSADFHPDESFTIEITSDLDFAGIHADDETCETGDKAFAGESLNLLERVSLVGAKPNSIARISGLCFISDKIGDVGFVMGAKKIENFHFDKVYFKSTLSHSNVGIVAKNVQKVEFTHVYQNIRVTNSEFFGNDVGAILGYGYAYISDISLANVVIDGGNHAGGVVGNFTAEDLELASGDVYEYRSFNIENLKIVKAKEFNSNDAYFGGIAGYVSQDRKKEWNNISIVDLEIQEADYAGGLLGTVNYNSQVTADASKYSEIYIGINNAAKSLINAKKYAGGLVGYINEGSAAGSAITVAKTSVNADVKGNGDSDSYVGGLIGFINFSSSDKMKLTITNNNIVGNVYGAGDEKKVGYLVGVLNYSMTDFNVKYNYHYGDYVSTEHYAKIGIGSFEDGTNDNWLNPSVNTGSTAVISHNFRNEKNGKSAGTSLAKDGDLVNQPKPVQKSSTEGYYNGVISSSDMKKSDFAKVLNGGGSGVTATGAWKSDGDDLPYLNTNVVADNNNYHVSFDIAAVENITQTIAGKDKKASYSIIVPKKFYASGNKYSSYNTDKMSGNELDLPPLYAVTADPELGSSANYSYNVHWTIWRDSSHCEVGSSIVESQKTKYYCVQSVSFDHFGQDLIDLAQDNNKLDVGKTMTLYPVWEADNGEMSTLDVECTPSSTYDCSEKPLDLVLSQKFEMGGQSYESKQSTADGKILLPQSGMYDFDVSFVVNPGFKFDNPYEGDIDGIDPNEVNAFELAYDQTNKKISLGPNDAAPVYDLYYKTKPEAKFELVNYTVNFDFGNLLNGTSFDEKKNRLVFDNSVDNEQDYDKVRGYVVFGNAWASNSWKSSKANMNVGKDARNFPNAYVCGFDKSGNAKFFKLRWGVDASKTDSYDYLTSALLKEALGDNLDATKIYAYAIDAENYMKNENTAAISRRIISVFALDKKDEKLTAATDYHGSIELSQEIGGVKFVQESKLFELAYPKYAHRLIIPQTTNAFDDTLTFDVSVNPDPGYEMTLEFDPKWANVPANEGWGYSPTEGRLKYLANSMNGAHFNIKYSLLPYDLHFSISEALRDKGLFVANNDNDMPDWFAKQENVTLETMSAPTLYNSEGCRVGWVVEGDGIEDHHATTLKDEVQYMTSTKKTSGFVNKLVPDYSKPLCSGMDDSYTITLKVEGEGEIRLQQRLANGTDKIVMSHSFTKKDGKLVLSVPKASYGASDVETSVTLRISATSAQGYLFDNVTIDGATDAAAQTKKDGDEITVTGNMNLTAHFIKLDPVYVAYDLSLAKTAEDSAKTYLPVDAVTSQKIEIDSKSAKEILWAPSRSDKCFAGWSPKPEATRTANDPVYEEIGYKNLNDLSKDETKPTMLYAAWENNCTPTNKIQVVYGSDKSTLVLYQKFGKASLFHEASDVIMLADGSYDFYIDTERSVPDLGYQFNSNYRLRYKESSQTTYENVLSENGAWRIESFGKSRYYVFERDLTTISYELVFNENAGSDKPFFGDSWKDILTKDNFGVDANGNWTVKQIYGVTKNDKKFPMAIYRDGYCLQGYTLAKNDKTNGVFKEFTDDFMQKYAALGASSPTPMYAYWESCDQGFTVYAVDSDKGTLTLSRTFDLGDSKKTTRTYEVGTNGLKISSVNNDVSFTGILFAVNSNADVILDTEKPYTYREHGGTGEWNEFNGTIAVTSDLDIKAPLYKNLFNSTYALDVNADEKDVFYGDGFDKFTWTAVQFGDKLPTNIYRTNAKLVGWSFEKDATVDKALTVFDKKFVEVFESYSNANQFNVNFDPTVSGIPVLFAVWETSVMPTWTVKSDDANKGKLNLEQSVDNKTFTYAVDKELLVPAVSNPLEFFVRFEPDDNWVLAASESLVWKDANGNSNATENETYQRIDKDYVVTALGSEKPNEKPKEFNLVFDVSLDKDLYYGSGWAQEYEDVAGNKSKTFPTMVYSNDQCLAGWSVEKDGSTIYKELNDDLLNAIYAAYPNLDENTKIKLYARWTDDVKNCAGSFIQVSVEAKHGRVELVEKTEKDNTVHKFNDKGKVLVPSELDSDKWTLRVYPDEGYKLDSIVVKNGDNVVAVLHDGDKLPKNMGNAVLKAYFKENKTGNEKETVVKTDSVKIVNESFKTSGNTLQLNFTSTAFEENRNVFASVKIINMQTGKVVNQYDVTKSVESSSAESVTIRVDAPGSYKVVLSLLDGDKTVDEKTDFFTVRSPYESVERERWHMLSFTALDVSAIKWEDVHFYRWDESGVGEYWQYKPVRSGDVVDASQGVWFSSMSGEPLAMLSDYKDDDKDIVWNLECKKSGWNLVANPHGWYVNLYSNNKKHATDEESEVAFYRYNSETGGYVEITDVIKPYEAVWAKVSKKTQWVVSAEPVFVNEDSDQFDEEIAGDAVHGRNLAKSAAKDKWTLQLMLSDDKGKRDSWNLLGVSSHPFVAEEPPASMGDHVNLSIVDGTRALAKSVKAPSEDMEWTVALTASSIRNGYLTIGGIDGVKSLGYNVYVTVDDETTEMQEGKPLPVLLKSSAKTATVRVAKNAPVMAKNALIKGLRSTRLGDKLHVSFDAPKSLAGSNARVELLDVKGKVKATASARTLWGTNDVVLKAPQSGLYILRVRAGSEQQVRKIHVK